ncbi:unnamed protein product [Camellia sinensis]
MQSFKQEVYAGASKRALPENGILISGCQTDQTSADASPSALFSDKYDEESLGGTTVAQIFKKFEEMKNQCGEKRSDCIF